MKHLITYAPYDTADLDVVHAYIVAAATSAAVDLVNHQERVREAGSLVAHPQKIASRYRDIIMNRMLHNDIREVLILHLDALLTLTPALISERYQRAERAERQMKDVLPIPAWEALDDLFEDMKSFADFCREQERGDVCDCCREAEANGTS